MQSRFYNRKYAKIYLNSKTLKYKIPRPLIVYFRVFLTLSPISSQILSTTVTVACHLFTSPTPKHIFHSTLQSSANSVESKKSHHLTHRMLWGDVPKQGLMHRSISHERQHRSHVIIKISFDGSIDYGNIVEMSRATKARLWLEL